MSRHLVNSEELLINSRKCLSDGFFFVSVVFPFSYFNQDKYSLRMSNCQPNVMSVTNVGYRIRKKKKQTNNTHTLEIELKCLTGRLARNAIHTVGFCVRPNIPQNCVSVSRRINEVKQTHTHTYTQMPKMVKWNGELKMY